MKYSEIHQMFIKTGWKFDHAEGSHYFYTKNGELSEPIPYHGAKEIPKGIAIKLTKRYELKTNRKGGHRQWAK